MDVNYDNAPGHKQNTTRLTSSTLGWTRDNNNMHLYDFYVPDNAVPFFQRKQDVYVSDVLPDFVELDDQNQ